MKQPRFCRDCEHVRVSLIDRLCGFGYRFALCALAPRSPRGTSVEELVTGRPYQDDDLPDYFNCTTVRETRWLCGPSGTLFRPRHPRRRPTQDASVPTC